MPIRFRPSLFTITLSVTLLVQSLVALGQMAVPAVAPAVARTMSVSPAYVGLYIAILYTGAVLASLMGGSIVRRYGAIRASQAGLLFCALGLLLYLGNSIALATIGAFLIGVGYGPITPASSHLLAQTTPAARLSFVFSIKQTGVPLGGALAGLAIPGLAQLASWQLAFALVAGICVLCAASIQPLRRRLDTDQDPAHRLSFGNGIATPLRLVMRQRSLTVLAAVSFLFSVIQLSLTAYLVTWLHDELGMSLVKAGLILAVAQGAGVAGRLLWGLVSDRLTGAAGALSALSVLTIVVALLSPLLVPLGSIVITLIVLAIFGACAIGWNGVYLAEVARQAPPGLTSIATGGTLALTFSGVVFGPPVFGLVATATGSYGIAYASLALPACLCLGLLWGFRREFRRAPAGTGHRAENR